MRLREAALALLCAGAMATASAQPVMEPATASSSAQPIPFKQERESTGDLTGRVVGALAVCLLLGGAAIYALSRRRGVGAFTMRGQRLQVLETKRVGLKKSLVLVRWDDEELLLADGLTQLEVVARKPAVAAAPAVKETPL